MAENKKSLDELLSKKSNKTVENTNSDTSEKDAMRARMNRTVNANKVFETNEEKVNDNQNEENEKKLNELNEKVNSLNSEITSLKEELSKEKDKSASLNKELEDNKTSLKELKAKQTNTKSSTKQVEKLNNDKQDLKQTISDLKKDNSSKDTKINKLNESIEKLNETVSNNKKDLVALKSSQTKLENKISKLEEEKQAKLDEIASLKKDIKDKTKENENLKNKLDSLKEEYKNYKAENKVKEVVVDNSDRIKELEDEIASLQAQAKESNEQSDNTENDSNKIKELEDEIATLNEKVKENEEAYNLNKELTTELVSAKEERDNLFINFDNKVNEKVNEVKTENENNLKALQEKYDSIENEYNSLKQELENSVTISEDELKKKEELANDYNNLLALVDEYKQEKEKLDSEIKEYLDTLASQDEIIDKQSELLSHQQEVLENKINEYNEILNNASLKDKTSEDKLNQLNNEILALQSSNSELNASIKEKENELNDAFIKLNEVNKDLNEKDKLINSLQNKDEKNNDKINKLNDEVEELKINLADYEEIKNNSDVNQLREKIANLEKSLQSTKDELSKANTNVSSPALYKAIDQYRDLLQSERQSHTLSEDILYGEIDRLSKEVKDKNKELSIYSNNYLFNQLNSQIKTLNSIIEAINDSNVLINRDIYSDCYIEACNVFNNQKVLFKKEIAKRNDLLAVLKEELKEEIAYRKDVTNNLSNPRISELSRMITDIEVIISNEVKTSNIISPERVEDEIIQNFKHSVLTIHKEMEENYLKLQKELNEKYDKVSSLDELVNAYDLDCETMANKYASEIDELYTFNTFDKNEYSKVLREEKILLLANEFQKLIRLRDKKYESMENKFQVEINASTMTDLNNSIDSYEELKKQLKDQLDQLEAKENNDYNDIKQEVASINEDINDLTSQLTRINDNEKLDPLTDYTTDKKKINSLIKAKSDRIEYLNTIKVNDINKEYQETKDKIKAEYNKVLLSEKDTKELFDKRVDALNQSRRLKAYNDSFGLRKKAYENINTYLLDLNKIDDIYNSVKNKRANTTTNTKEANDNNQTNITASKENLWKLYDKYISIKKTMEEDNSDVRKYISLVSEYNGANKNYIETSKEIGNSEEVDRNKEVRLVGIKNQVDNLNMQVNSVANIEKVKEYIELNEKINQIIELIKAR